MSKSSLYSSIRQVYQNETSSLPQRRLVQYQSQKKQLQNDGEVLNLYNSYRSNRLPCRIIVIRRLPPVLELVVVTTHFDILGGTPFFSV